MKLGSCRIVDWHGAHTRIWVSARCRLKCGYGDVKSASIIPASLMANLQSGNVESEYAFPTADGHIEEDALTL